MKNKVFITMVLIILIAMLGGIAFGYYKKVTMKVENPIVTMEVENYGTIKIELYPDKAPNTVKNFIALANNGFYNGLKFHRIIKDFMIQGGDFEGTGSGDALIKYFKGNDDETKYSIKGEFMANGYVQNDLNLEQGVIAMARADYTQYSSNLREESYNSAGTQFFIMTTSENTALSGAYAGFGKVIEGMDIVTKIAEVEVVSQTEYNKLHGEENNEDADKEENTEAEQEESTENKEIPKEDVIISSVTVDKKGVDYGYPETLEPFNYMKWIYSLYGIPYNE